MEDKTNINFIYTYTEAFLKDRDTSLRSLNTKCAGLVALSGALLKSFVEIEGCADCNRLKIGVLISLALAMISGLIGLLAKACGDVADPVTLYKDYYYESEEISKRDVIGTWHKAIEQLTKQAKYKGYCFNIGIFFTVLAILFTFIRSFLKLT